MNTYPIVKPALFPRCMCGVLYVVATVQILFDSGLIMVLLYFVHFGLWAIVPPVVVEIFEVSYLIFLKAYFQRAAASQKGDQADILGKKLLSKDGLSQHNDEEKGGSDPADYSPNFGNGNGNGNGSTF